MQRLLSQRKRNGISHWISTVDEQKQPVSRKLYGKFSRLKKNPCYSGQDNFCVCWTSYSRGEAPHLNYLHSRCLRHTSNEAGRIRGSCTQTGRGGSMCRWESGWLKVRIILLNLCPWPNSKFSILVQDTYGKTSHPYSPDSRGFHRIWSVQRCSVHCHTGSNRDDKSATLQQRQITGWGTMSHRSILNSWKRGAVKRHLSN